MTTENKPRKPRTFRRRSESMVRDAGLRRIVVTLYPSGLLGLRPERRRREETLDAAAAWQFAVRTRVAAERAAKRKSKGG